mgnify:CR=1 FL=1
MQPAPPKSLPKYVREGVERQDTDTLQELAEWAEELAEWKNREVKPADIEEELVSDEQLEDIETPSSGGTIVEKKIPCGKDCGGCPHGPYRYEVHREGDSLKWEYKGKV